MMFLVAGTLVLIPVVILIFTALHLSKKYGEIKSEIEALREAEEYEKELDDIANQPERSADQLLEWMRSPHSNH